LESHPAHATTRNRWRCVSANTSKAGALRSLYVGEARLRSCDW
jgi:hypothetical protein